MKNTMHRVMILNNVNSDMISGAILILKDSAAGNDTALLMEAERVVEKYMKSGGGEFSKGKSIGLPAILAGGCILAAGFVLLAYLI